MNKSPLPMAAPRPRAPATSPSVLRRLASALLLVTLCATARADEDANLRAAVAAERARPAAPTFARVDFIARPVLIGAWLSPDGRRIAFLKDEGANRGIWLLPTAGGTPRRVLVHTDASELSWSRDGRWLFLASARQLYALAVAGQSGSGAIDRLGGTWERRFVGVDPASPAAAFVLESPPPASRQPRRWRIQRVDVKGARTQVHEDSREIIDFEVGPSGRLAYLTRLEGEAHVILRMDQGRARPVLRCERLQRCSMLGTRDQGRILLLNTDAGADLGRLAQLDPEGRLTTLHGDPRGEADLSQVTRDPVTGEPLFASYRSTVAMDYGLQAEASRSLGVLRQRLPDRDLRIEVGRGAGARWLVHERAASLKGERLHVYDPRTGELREVLGNLGFRHDRTDVRRLPESAMARKIAFSWRASDGMRVHGFVLVPPGVDAARAPLVANVHGGPFNLFRPEFSGQSQMLANRGYVVFEPNFRGSTGHGRRYLFAGNGDFGNGRVQQDIVEGVRHLLAQGIGDGERVGILGASFGGYSALQGVTFQPDLFKVGIAAVPPADFGWVLRWYAGGRDQMTRGVPMAATMRMLSLDPADARVMERLRAQSPIANAALLRRPVLLLAGADDERVPIRSVLHYAAQLQSLGKDVTLFVDAEGRHQLVNPVTREAYLYLVEAMLHRHLGGRAPLPPDAGLREALRRNLRLDDEQLRPR